MQVASLLLPICLAKKECRLLRHVAETRDMVSDVTRPAAFDAAGGSDCRLSCGLLMQVLLFVFAARSESQDHLSSSRAGSFVGVPDFQQGFTRVRSSLAHANRQIPAPKPQCRFVHQANQSGAKVFVGKQDLPLPLPTGRTAAF